MKSLQISTSGANPGNIVMDNMSTITQNFSCDTTTTTEHTTTTTENFSPQDVARIGDLKKRATAITELMKKYQSNFFSVIGDHRFVLAGGCFTSWYHGELPKDHDMFILDWYGGKVFDDKLQWSEERYKLSDENYLNAMSHNKMIVDVILDKMTNVQYILTKYKTREELIKHFDVEHACVSYVPANDKLYVSPLTFDCIKNKKLRSHNGKIADWRQLKFMQKGFTLETVSV